MLALPPCSRTDRQVRITNKAHAHSHWQRQVSREAHVHLREEAGRLLPEKPPRLAFIHCPNGEDKRLSPDGSEPQPFHSEHGRTDP